MTPLTNYICRCDLVEMPTMAELLMDLAHSVKYPRDLLVLPIGVTVTDFGLSRVKLALELDKRRPLVLRAVVEGWDLERIIREIY